MHNPDDCYQTGTLIEMALCVGEALGMHQWIVLKNADDLRLHLRNSWRPHRTNRGTGKPLQAQPLQDCA